MNDLMKALATGLVSVTFTKKDGSQRKMICTKNLEMVPGKDHPKGTGKAAPAGVCRVYEQGNGWRSFREDSVLSWEHA